MGRKDKVVVEFVDDVAIFNREKKSAGYDVCACIDSPVTLGVLERKLIPVGIKLELPKNYECQVRPRSGNAIKFGITVLNTPGTIDEDYRGVVGVIIINLSHEPFIIKRGDKIAQLVFNKVKHPKFVEGIVRDDTERGSGGFGSTGLNVDDKI